MAGRDQRTVLTILQLQLYHDCSDIVNNDKKEKRLGRRLFRETKQPENASNPGQTLIKVKT